MSINPITLPPEISPISGKEGIITIIWSRFFNSIYNNLRYVMPSLSSNVGDAGLTLNPVTAQGTYIWNTPLTGSRTITMGIGAVAGNKVRFTRTAAATGAFTLTFNGKSIAAGQWMEWEYSTAWFQTAGGNLL